MFWSPSDGTTQIEVGTILPWPDLDIPEIYLECDGSLLSRSTYSELFAAIGTTWGVGDGVTTFAIPDFRGSFLRGYDHAKGFDTGRVFATYQADAVKYAYFYNSPSSPVYWLNTGGALSTGEGPTAAENRPKNHAIYWCIKY